MTDEWSAMTTSGWSGLGPRRVCALAMCVLDSQLLFNAICLFPKGKPGTKHAVLLNEKKI